MKQCQQVSKFNDCRTLLEKSDKKLYILAKSGLEWYGKDTATNTQYQIGQKKMLTQSQTIFRCKKSCNTKQI